MGKELAGWLHPKSRGKKSNAWVDIRDAWYPSGSTLFNIFTGNIKSGIEYTLSKCSGDTKLRGAVDTFAGRDAIQRAMNRLEKCIHANIKKFSKGLHLGVGYPKHTQNRIESNPVERDFSVPAYEKLNMSWRCTLATQKANYILSCIKGMHGQHGQQVKEVILTLFFSLVLDAGAGFLEKLWMLHPQKGSRSGLMGP